MRPPFRIRVRSQFLTLDDTNPLTGKFDQEPYVAISDFFELEAPPDETSHEIQLEEQLSTLPSWRFGPCAGEYSSNVRYAFNVDRVWGENILILPTETMRELLSYVCGGSLRLNMALGFRIDPGGFALPHQDPDHYVNVVFYLNEFWHPDWGGRLEFRQEGRDWHTIAQPTLGGVAIFKHDDSWVHQMTPVADTAPARFSVTLRYGLSTPG